MEYYSAVMQGNNFSLSNTPVFQHSIEFTDKVFYDNYSFYIVLPFIGRYNLFDPR